MALWLLSLVVWPAAAGEDVSLASMTEHAGEAVVDRDLLGQSVRQLVREIGTAVARQPGPARTPGADGLRASLSMGFVATEGRYRVGEPSPWNRAHPTEDNAPWIGVPTLSVQKGLPFSLEVGGHVGWLARSDTGLAGVWGRMAVLGGFRKLPEVAVHIGYTGYVGNPELDVGVLQVGGTLSGRRALGRVPAMHSGHVSPWFDLSVLRASARAAVGEELTADLGIADLEASSIVRFGVGVEVQSGPAFLQLGATWSPATIPVASAGLGVAL